MTDLKPILATGKRNELIRRLMAGTSSPDDPALATYWATRRRRTTPADGPDHPALTAAESEAADLGPGLDLLRRPPAQIAILLIPDRRERTCPRAAKRARHHNYRVKPDEPANTRHRTRATTHSTPAPHDQLTLRGIEIRSSIPDGD